MIAAILAVAIYFTDATPHEARLLMSVAKHESHFSRAVLLCHVRGDHGRSLGAYQLQPRNDRERRDACDVTRASRLALARVRESIATCGDLTGYVSGRCGVGKRAARERWVE